VKVFPTLSVAATTLATYALLHRGNREALSDAMM
jgi:hypothetical protein